MLAHCFARHTYREQASTQIMHTKKKLKRKMLARKTHNF